MADWIVSPKSLIINRLSVLCKNLTKILMNTPPSPPTDSYWINHGSSSFRKCRYQSVWLASDSSLDRILTEGRARTWYGFMNFVFGLHVPSENTQMSSSFDKLRLSYIYHEFGSHLNIIPSHFQYWSSHCKDTMISRPPYLYNGNLRICKKRLPIETGLESYCSRWCHCCILCKLSYGSFALQIAAETLINCIVWDVG